MKYVVMPKLQYHGTPEPPLLMHLVVYEDGRDRVTPTGILNKDGMMIGRAKEVIKMGFV